MAKYIIKIVDDLSKLNERMDEVLADTSLDTIKSTIKDLKDTIKYTQVPALAAPQIGIKLRLFCMRMADKTIKTFLNPMIVQRKGEHFSREINPCIKGKEYIMPRNEEVAITYQEFNGLINTVILKGPAADTAQQMVELLDGIMICDYGLEVIPGFDEASEDEKAQILKMYTESLKNRDIEMQRMINAESGLKEFNDIINFRAGLLDGSIKPIFESGEEGEESGSASRVQ